MVERTIASEWDWEARSSKAYNNFLTTDADNARNLDDVTWEFKNGTLFVQNIVNGREINPIHPNAHLLLETIKQLNPDSVADFGCGFGDTLHNIGLLLPNAKLYGYDVSVSRLKYLRQRVPMLNERATLQQHDLGLPLKLTPADLAYTSITVMHILGDRHLTALQNIFETADKHVVLMENWQSHSFMDDIKGLDCGWNELYFYYRYCIEFARPHLMVVSKDNQLPYERLYDYDATMRQPLVKAMEEGRP